VRIAKYIARTGAFSRREAEHIILQGKVSIGNEVITNLAHKLSGNEEIFINGKKIPKIEPTRVWIYHKREGLLTANYDPDGRETIFSDINLGVNHVIPVGRLDKNTEGLLLLTNDGDYSRKLELPANNFERTYLVKVFGIPDKEVLKKLEKGIIIDGVEYKKIIVKIEEQSLNNAWLEITLIEGKNREIRNVMNYLGYRIKRLIRIAYGPYKLGKLQKGKIIEVETKCLE